MYRASTQLYICPHMVTEPHIARYSGRARYSDTAIQRDTRIHRYTCITTPQAHVNTRVLVERVGVEGTIGNHSYHLRASTHTDASLSPGCSTRAVKRYSDRSAHCTQHFQALDGIRRDASRDCSGGRGAILRWQSRVSA